MEAAALEPCLAIAVESASQFLRDRAGQREDDVDEVAAPKPAPDPYLAACFLLDVSPARALAVEDSAVGIASARAAGMSVLSVGRAARMLESDGHIDGLDDPILRHWIGQTARRTAELASY